MKFHLLQVVQSYFLPYLTYAALSHLTLQIKVNDTFRKYYSTKVIMSLQHRVLH